MCYVIVIATWQGKSFTILFIYVIILWTTVCSWLWRAFATYHFSLVFKAGVASQIWETGISAHRARGLQQSGPSCQLARLLQPCSFSPLFYSNSPFLAHQKKNISFFSLWGDPIRNRPQNPALAGCPFSTRKSRSEVPERGDFGEENYLGKGGVDRGTKGKKDVRKKRLAISGKGQWRFRCRKGC